MSTVCKPLALLALVASLSACGGVETASRNAMPDLGPMQGASVQPTLADARIVDFDVVVPDRLRVSEANAYIPKADIVWRGDAPGDRHAQVRAIFQNSLRLTGSVLEGETPVRVSVKVRRFHALTEKARYTTGGVHNIVFDMELRHAVTGDLLRPVRTVRADLRAFGGRRAIEADAMGHTQKFRITRHLATVINEELTTVTGHRNARLGLIQQLNNMM